MTRQTPGPWDYIAGNEHHGPYVMGPYGDIADCYVMSNPNVPSVRNGGTSRPINHCGEEAEFNARLIAAAPEMRDALEEALACLKGTFRDMGQRNDAAIKQVEAALAKTSDSSGGSDNG